MFTCLQGQFIVSVFYAWLYRAFVWQFLSRFCSYPNVQWMKQPVPSLHRAASAHSIWYCVSIYRTAVSSTSVQMETEIWLTSLVMRWKASQFSSCQVVARTSPAWMSVSTYSVLLNTSDTKRATCFTSSASVLLHIPAEQARADILPSQRL